MNTMMLVLLSFWLLLGGQSRAEVPNPETHSAAERPNIILLFVDDLGWNDLGYRNPKFETPNIDHLATESIDFQRAYVASPTCSPSRATLLTGKHPARLKLVRHIPTGAKNGFDQYGRTDNEFHRLESDPAKFPSRNWLPLEHTTYAEALQSLGYDNQFIGKWHLGHEAYHPIHQGFEGQIGTTNFGHPHSYMAPFFKNSDVFAEITKGHLTDTLTDEALRFLREYDRDQPFMLSLWYYGVHRPPVGRPDLVEHFQNKGYDKNESIYAAQVKAVDESAGRIRQTLRDEGLDRNTVVIFTSDQGSLYTNAPLRGNKRVDTLCEGGSRVPLLIHVPVDTVVESIARVTRVPVQTTDLFPTLVELAGGAPSDFRDLDGVSLLSLIRGGEPPKRETPLIGYRAYEDLYASVRRDNWKLLAYRSGKTCLYDIETDMSEVHDVAAENSEIVASMKDDLIAWEQRMNVAQYSAFQTEHMIGRETVPNHLYGARLLRRRLERTNPSKEQLEAFDQLSDQYTADVMALREAVGIDRKLIQLRDKAYKKLKEKDLTGDAFWLKFQEETGITDRQREAFRKTKERSNRFKSEAKHLMNPFSNTSIELESLKSK